ncbi:MAG: hypothetical protein ACOZQL_14070 [Myxococcota bacterium]
MRWLVAAVLVFGCAHPAPPTTPAEATEQRALRVERCDPSSPPQPEFVELEEWDQHLSPLAFRLARGSEPAACAEGVASPSLDAGELQRGCEALAARHPKPDERAACVEACLSNSWYFGARQVHLELVSVVEALSVRWDACGKESSPERAWLCAGGRKVPAGFRLERPSADVFRVTGRFRDGGQTWTLESVRFSTCGRTLRLVQQPAPRPGPRRSPAGSRPFAVIGEL